MAATTVLFKGDVMLKSLSVLVVCVAFLSGCTTVTIKGTKKIDDMSYSIQKGQTTKQDVLSEIGNPIEISHRDDGADVYVYERVKFTSSIPQYCSWALPLSLGFWTPCYIRKEQSDVTRLSLSVNHETGVVEDYNVDQLSYDGPYFRTAAEAAQAAAQQAAARAAAIHQNTYKPTPTPTYTPQYHHSYGSSKY
jgi:hypothetical protein